MRNLANLVLSLCDLLEAEGRVLKWNIKTVGLGCAFCGLGLIFVGAALAFIVSAIYAVLAEFLPTPAVLLISAGICAIIGSIILWSGKKWMQKSEPARKPDPSN